MEPALPYAGEVVRFQCSSDGGVEGGREEGQGGAEVRWWQRRLGRRGRVKRTGLGLLDGAIVF